MWRLARELHLVPCGICPVTSKRPSSERPESGFEVTVYGDPRNAVLTIKSSAGRLANPALWRERAKELAIRLRRHYDCVGSFFG
jgi:hypothetical protein